MPSTSTATTTTSSDSSSSEDEDEDDDDRIADGDEGGDSDGRETVIDLHRTSTLTLIESQDGEAADCPTYRLAEVSTD